MRKQYPLKVSGLMLVVILAFINPTNLFAQNLKEITGVVSSASGNLAGVSVTVKVNPKIGAITDENGTYRIKVPDNRTLVFQSVGYKTVEMPLNDRSTIDITMEITSVNLGEVVVVGYGTQKKATLTGAVTVVKGSDIAKSPTAEV